MRGCERAQPDHEHGRGNGRTPPATPCAKTFSVLYSYGVAVFAEPRSGAGWSVGIPQPYLSTPWANHGTSELLLEVWHKREGWCGPPMVGRPVITVTPARAFRTGLEVGGFRFRRTLPNHVETEPSFQVGGIYWGRGPRGVCPLSPTGRDVRDPRVTLRFGCNTTVRRVHRLHAPRRGVLSTFHM